MSLVTVHFLSDEQVKKINGSEKTDSSKIGSWLWSAFLRNSNMAFQVKISDISYLNDWEIMNKLWKFWRCSLSNMLISLFRSADEIPGKPSSLAYMPINDHFGSLFSSFRNTFLAYLAVFYLHPGGQDYPVRVVKFRNFNSWFFMVS